MSALAKYFHAVGKQVSGYDKVASAITEGLRNIGIVTHYEDSLDLIPENFKSGSRYKKTGKAGIFAGSLELVKEGNLSMKQDNLFDDIYVREIND